jgi:hypothetical protein
VISHDFPHTVEQENRKHATQNQTKDDDDDYDMFGLAAALGLLKLHGKQCSPLWSRRTKWQPYMTLGRLFVLIEPAISTFVARQIFVDARSIVTVELVLVAKTLWKDKHGKIKY